MLSSVRVRLTIWYTAVMTCVLMVLVIVTYVLLQRNAIHRTDAIVIEQADSFLKTLNAEMHDVSVQANLEDAASVAVAEHRFRETLFTVLDEKGNVVASSVEKSTDEDVPADSAESMLRLATRTAKGKDSPFRTVHVHGRPYRSYLRSFSVDGKNCMLLVLQSLQPQEEFLETLTGTFALVIPLAILLAGSGGYFLARQSLSPVVAMSTQASRIGSENLYERLKVENAQDELGHLAMSFNELLDRISQSFERQRRFIADASHELRTPVAILCGEAEVTLAEKKREETEYRESLNILLDESKRLKHIVEDLFTLARADAGQYPLAPTKFYLDELAAECARNVRTLALAKNITLHCETPKELAVTADEELVRRMILNLLDNAIKYTPDGGTVTIASGEQNSDYFVSVKDTGPGIPAALRERVFERFFRVDKARARSENDGGGAGLGLSIASWIAQAHRGRVELTRSDESGSTFTIFLPTLSGT
jgi:heavy metal sensor kinase